MNFKPPKSLIYQEKHNTVLKVLELLSDAVIIVDKEANIFFLNAVALDIFGYRDPKDLLGQKIEVLIPQKYRKSHIPLRNSYSKDPKKKLMAKRRQLKGLRKDNQEFNVEISLSPITLDEMQGSIALIRDTSTRDYIKLLEQKNKELEEITYITSHDLQEPISTIKSFSELLLDEYHEKFDENGKMFLNVISKTINRMKELVTAILDLSIIGKDKLLSEVNCKQLIDEIIQDLNFKITETKAVFQIEELPIILAYKVELRQLFQNIISNALKFTHKDRVPNISISARKEGNAYIFSLKDNGIGIKKEHFSKIFSIFQVLNKRENYEGTGIGLANCKKIIDLHQGEIWVESTLNVGTTFFIKIPKYNE